MSIPVIQAHGPILPAYSPLGTEHEDIDDLVEHTSREFYIADIHEKTIQIVAIENVVAGVPGQLWIWVELSPVPSTTSTAYWAAIGGGGGGMPPTVPTLIAATGVDATTHTAFIGWAVHSVYARAVVQTPVAAALPNAFWQVQLVIQGKTP